MNSDNKNTSEERRPVAIARRGRPPKGLSSIASIRYAELRAKYPEMSVRDAKTLCGYHPNSVVSVDAQLAMSIQQQRDHAIRATGYTIEHALQTLYSITADTYAHHGDKIRAVHEANSMLPGYHAPEQLQVQSKGIFMELSALSSSDLTQMIEILEDKSI